MTGVLVAQLPAGEGNCASVKGALEPQYPSTLLWPTAV